MYLDGASMSPTGEKQEDVIHNKDGIWVVYVTPHKAILLYSFAQKRIVLTTQQNTKQ